MQIKLKQAEIERAIRAYVTHMGVSLAGKDVKIDFTAGRGETGLVADVDIEEAADAQAAPSAPVGVVKQSKAVLADLPNETTVAAMNESRAMAERVSGVPEVAEAQAEAAPTGKSLFG